MPKLTPYQAYQVDYYFSHWEMHLFKLSRTPPGPGDVCKMVYAKENCETRGVEVRVKRLHQDGTYRLELCEEGMERLQVYNVDPDLIHWSVCSMPDKLVWAVQRHAGLHSWNVQPHSEVAYRYRYWKSHLPASPATLIRAAVTTDETPPTTASTTVRRS